MEEETRTHLPVLKRRAVWNDTFGLIVSPFGRPLPLEIGQGEVTKSKDFLQPRLLEDKHIYLGFYPKETIAYGALLGPLSIDKGEELRDRIVKVDQKFTLDFNTQKTWANIETLMLSIGATLINRHELYSFLPPLHIPAFPTDCGYQLTFPSLDEAHIAARVSLKRFSLLSAYATFAISLWLSPHREDAFDSAFQCLQVHAGLDQATLHHVKDSAICNLSPYFRTGCFLDAINTRWGRLIYRIGRAGIPLWLRWGDDERCRLQRYYTASRTIQDEFYPPDDYLRAVKSRATGLGTPILPDPPTFSTIPDRPDSDNFDVGRPGSPLSNNFDSDLPSGFDDRPIEPPPMTVIKGARQRVGESWPEFKARLTARLEQDKNDPIMRNKMAGRQNSANLSQERGQWISKKSKVFEWFPDDYHKDYFVRTPLDDPMDSWDKYTKYQRFYWSHIDEWDLVGHVERYPPHVPQSQRVVVEDLDDPDHPNYDVLRSKPHPEVAAEVAAAKAKEASQALLKNIRAVAEEKIIGAEIDFLHLPFSDYLRLRHGFNVDVLHVSGTYLWERYPSSFNVDFDAWCQVPRRLNYKSLGDQNSYSTPLIDFHNTAMSFFGTATSQMSQFRVSDLCPSWDYVSGLSTKRIEFLELEVARAAPFQEYIFEATSFTLQHVLQQQSSNRLPSKDIKLYVLKPSARSPDKSTWFIATTDPTTILYVVRKGLSTMHSIADALLECGIPFRTVEKKMTRGPSTSNIASTPEGSYHTIHEAGWRPGKNDYIAYVSAREELLKSHLGRSIYARGGIAGRMAAGVVKPYEVSSGPVRCDEVVGYAADGGFFVDDFIPKAAFETLAGVYRFRVTKNKGRVKFRSWFPTQDRWMGSGTCGDHWTPDAETWYRGRQQAIFDEYQVVPYTEWKVKLEWQRKQYPLLRGCRGLAAEFLAQVI